MSSIAPPEEGDTSFSSNVEILREDAKRSWSTESEEVLLKTLTQLHERLIRRCKRTAHIVEQLDNSAASCAVQLENTFSAISLLSQLQFVQHRIANDDLTKSVEKEEEVLSDAPLSPELEGGRTAVHQRSAYCRDGTLMPSEKSGTLAFEGQWLHREAAQRRMMQYTLQLSEDTEGEVRIPVNGDDTAGVDEDLSHLDKFFSIIGTESFLRDPQAGYGGHRRLSQKGEPEKSSVDTFSITQRLPIPQQQRSSEAGAVTLRSTTLQGSNVMGPDRNPASSSQPVVSSRAQKDGVTATHSPPSPPPKLNGAPLRNKAPPTRQEKVAQKRRALFESSSDDSSSPVPLSSPASRRKAEPSRPKPLSTPSVKSVVPRIPPAKSREQHMFSSSSASDDDSGNFLHRSTNIQEGQKTRQTDRLSSSLSSTTSISSAAPSPRRAPNPPSKKVVPPPEIKKSASSLSTTASTSTTSSEDGGGAPLHPNTAIKSGKNNEDNAVTAIPSPPPPPPPLFPTVPKGEGDVHQEVDKTVTSGVLPPPPPLWSDTPSPSIPPPPAVATSVVAVVPPPSLLSPSKAGPVVLRGGKVLSTSSDEEV